MNSGQAASTELLARPSHFVDVTRADALRHHHAVISPHHIAPRRDGDTENSPSRDNHDRSRGVEEFRSVSRQRRERSARPSRDAVERFERQT